MQEKPDLDPGLQWLWTSYLDLRLHRQHWVDMEGKVHRLGPISFQEIESYARIKRLNAADIEDLIWFLPRIDATYREHASE